MTRAPLHVVAASGRTVTDSAVAALQRDFRGDLLRPADEGYDAARQVWNGMVDRRPALVARCTGVADVRAALRFAEAEGFEVTVRGGGHGVVGHAVADGAVAVDLSGMRSARVDPAARRAWVQGGARLRDLDRETLQFGLGTTVGLVGDTGVGGLTLGGGYGFAARRHGLSCDNIVAAEVVTADGDLLVVDQQSHPDLLWGLRGGGGNFGVVTGLEFRLHPLHAASYGDYVYPAEHGVRALRALLDFLPEAPDDLYVMAGVLEAPEAGWIPDRWHGHPVVWLGWVFLGDLDEGRRICAPLAEAGRPVGHDEQATTYADLQASGDADAAGPGRHYWRGGLVRDLPDDLLEALVTRGTGSTDEPAPCSVEVVGLGGAIARVGEDDTAFSGRDALADVLVMAHWSEPAEDDERLAAARRLADLVGPHTRRAYVNSLDSEGAHRVRAAYGEDKYRRLVALKDRYDPANVFRHNQNVLPSAAAVPAQRG